MNVTSTKERIVGIPHLAAHNGQHLMPTDDDSASDEFCRACDAWTYGEGLQCIVHGEEATQRHMRENGAAFDAA